MTSMIQSTFSVNNFKSEVRTMKKKLRITTSLAAAIIVGTLMTLGCNVTPATQSTYSIVDTGQSKTFDETKEIPAPSPGQAFYGQDAQFSDTQPSYTKSSDGLTVKDNVTGLTWQQSHCTVPLYWTAAKAVPAALNAARYGGYSDWRLPTIKELYSLWNGSTGWPYIDTNYFTINYTSQDELSHAIFWSSNKYTGLLESTLDPNTGAEMAFGVNFGTGHIKAYTINAGPTHFVRCVRGDIYGVNNFQNNNDGTITDQATGLMWAQADSGSGMDWEHALAFAQSQNAANYLGHNDWRLPNSKELQSIVDYTRSPGATDAAKVGPAIDPLFDCTGITNEAGTADYPFYWTNTSAKANATTAYDSAWHVAFGRAVDSYGKDLHGAGAVRFDAKVAGSPGGEARYLNFVRLVRNTKQSTYSIVDTGQSKTFDNMVEISAPSIGQAFYGQDAQFSGTQPSYTLSADGLTVHDNVTGLIWQQSPDTNGDGTINASDKMTLTQAQERPSILNAANYGGYNNWRLPTIKELYSLINFMGTDVGPGSDVSTLTPFIDRTYFSFGYGDTAAGERVLDAQYASSTLYVSKTMLGDKTLFGVNFADGRIKGYGLTMPGGGEKTFYVKCVQGAAYGKNDFADNGDGTITDQASGLMWTKGDSGEGMNWQEAMVWAQTKNAENYLGHSDWRLPNAKELQNIVDYTRSPDTTSSAAINPLLTCTGITNEAGKADYPYYWTGTTHISSDGTGAAAVYIAFGQSMGYMTIPGFPYIGAWLDVHGAGAQRSDPKVGNPADFPKGRGPQGDAIRIYNYMRLVRDAE